MGIALRLKLSFLQPRSRAQLGPHLAGVVEGGQRYVRSSALNVGEDVLVAFDSNRDAHHVGAENS